MLEIHNGQYSYIVDKVIYRGRELKTPVTLYDIQYVDLMFDLMLEAIREWSQEQKDKRNGIR